MRVTWRWTFGILLIGLWPHLGCLLTQADKTVQDERPPVQKSAATIKKDVPETAPTRVAQAAELERAGKYREAIALYENMREPGSPEALLATKLLAGMYLRHGDLERSEQEYRTLHQQNPQDAGVLSCLGDISCRRAHWYAAERYFSEALRHQPENASAQSGLGMALAQQGAYDRSVAVFKKLLKSESEAQCEVAFVMKLQGREREALHAYQTALSAEPGNKRARTELASLKQKGVTEPANIVRVSTPLQIDKHGIAELHTAPALASEGMSRLQMQRPTLPPLDVDNLADAVPAPSIGKKN